MDLTFYIAHQMQGRTRLRAIQRPVDPVELAGVSAWFGSLDGVVEVDGRADTGSLIVEYEDVSWQELEGLAIRRGILISDTPPQPARSGLAGIQSAGTQLNQSLKEKTGGGMDARSMGVALLLTLALVQAMRGRVLSPASSYLWYAINLILGGNQEIPG